MTSFNRLRTKLLKADRALNDVLVGSRDLPGWALPHGCSQEDWEQLCEDRASAENAFVTAVWGRTKADRDRFKNQKRRLTYRDGQRLRDDRSKAAARFDILCELGSAFYTRDEWHEMRAAAWLAEEKFQFAEQRFQEEQSAAGADARAGVVRVEDRYSVRHI